MKIHKIFIIGLLLAGMFVSCTDLNEELREDLPGDEAEQFLKESADVSSLLASVYRQMHEPFMDQSKSFALAQHTTDETIGPTRGGDWDDNGIWRVLHDHTWDANHGYVTDVFNQVLQVVFSTTNILSFDPSTADAAHARFLRAFAMFTVADNWNQVPFREPGGNLLDAPSVLQGAEALDFVISECNAILNDLPDGPEHKANKDAARVLLMKCYLNKGTFADRANPSFPAADMQQVISIADDIIGSGKYSLASNYFDNFAPTNDQISTENIFTFEHVPGVGGGDGGNSVRSRWFCSLHYNMTVSGWNGFTTLADFYDSFEDTDERKGGDYAGLTERTGINSGFLLGQQFNENGDALEDRTGLPLAFTRDINLIEIESNFEITGIRVVKYIPDLDSGDEVDNDRVFYRYADVLLMKAEALMRSGGSGALDIVNDIRTARGASMLSSLDEATLLDERGRELYWEEHRRQDMIRFGKFLDAWHEKPASGTERLLFPIPNTALAVNPNLTQNPGY